MTFRTIVIFTEMWQCLMNETKWDTLALNNLLSDTSSHLWNVDETAFWTCSNHGLQIVAFRQALLSTASSIITSLVENLEWTVDTEVSKVTLNQNTKHCSTQKPKRKQQSIMKEGNINSQYLVYSVFKRFHHSASWFSFQLLIMELFNKVLHSILSFRNCLVNLLHGGCICNGIPNSNTETILEKPVVDEPLCVTKELACNIWANLLPEKNMLKQSCLAERGGGKNWSCLDATVYMKSLKLQFSKNHVWHSAPIPQFVAVFRKPCMVGSCCNSCSIFHK